MLILKIYYFSRKSDLFSITVRDEDKNSIKISLRVGQKWSSSGSNLSAARSVLTPTALCVVH